MKKLINAVANVRTLSRTGLLVLVIGLLVAVNGHVAIGCTAAYLGAMAFFLAWNHAVASQNKILEAQERADMRMRIARRAPQG